MPTPTILTRRSSLPSLEEVGQSYSKSYLGKPGAFRRGTAVGEQSTFSCHCSTAAALEIGHMDLYTPLHRAEGRSSLVATSTSMIEVVLMILSATIKRASVIDGCTSASKVSRPLIAFNR